MLMNSDENLTSDQLVPKRTTYQYRKAVASTPIRVRFNVARLLDQNQKKKHFIRFANSK